MRRGSAALLALALLAGCAPRQQLTSIRRHPDLFARQRGVKSVAVVPPDVTVVEVQFVGDVERQRQGEVALARDLADDVTAKLRAKGYEVKPAVLAETDLGDDDALRLRLAKLDQAGRQMSFKLWRKGALPPAEAESARASVGPQVNPFAERAGADALVLVRMEAAVKSSGQQYADIFVGVLYAAGGVYYNAPEAGAILNVLLVDGISGEVLWANRRQMLFNERIQPELLVEAVMAEMPSEITLREGTAAAIAP